MVCGPLNLAKVLINPSRYLSTSRIFFTDLSSLLQTMPKEELHLDDLKEKRVQKRKSTALSQPANITWQVLGSGARGGPKSLLLYTDHRRYLFNCGEGTQRLTNQLSNTKRALAQMEHVFITSNRWENLGGLPGLCLSARSAGSPDMTIHGPPGCMELYEATKGFIMLYRFDVLEHSLDDGDYSDGAVTIKNVLLKRTTQLLAPPVTSEWFGLPDNMESAKIKYDNSAVAYICSFASKPGKLNIELCVDRGVKPGPMLGELKKGNDVTLEDGTVVRSSDVVATPDPPKAYLILELPDIEYLESFEAASELREIEHLQTIFHFSPISVVENPRYKAWMTSLDSNITHVFLNEDSTGMGLPDVSAFHHKLRTIRGDMFPRLQGAQDHCLGEAELKEELKRSDAIIQGKSGLMINVRPSNLPIIDVSIISPFLPSEVTKELLEGTGELDDEERQDYAEGMKQDLEYARNYGKDDITNVDEPDDKIKRKRSLSETFKQFQTACSFPRITFLGTGSSVPSKYRNVSGILVETEANNWILMDCGEGTTTQLIRLCGWDRAMEILRGLKAIYISHLHADHHLGLISLIQHRRIAFGTVPVPNLYVIATQRISSFLTYYHTKLEPILDNVELIKCEHLILYGDDPNKKMQQIYSERKDRLLADVGLSQIATCHAIHCSNSFCVVLTTSDGFKIAYSGDTRPNPSFCELGLLNGKGPDLLIHEATMEHFMLNDAKLKQHSTFTEAINIGREMNAKFTLLTHFSQRYAKMPLLAEIDGKMNVGIAFDNMSLTPDLFTFIPSIYPAISRWLWDQCEDMHEKGEMYKLKYSEDYQPSEGPSVKGIVETPLDRQEKAVKKHEEKLKKKEYLQKLAATNAAAKTEGLKGATVDIRSFSEISSTTK